MMLHGPISDPGKERRRRVMRCLFVLVAVAVLGYVLEGYGLARPAATTLE